MMCVHECVCADMYGCVLVQAYEFLLISTVLSSMDSWMLDQGTIKNVSFCMLPNLSVLANLCT